VFEETKRKWEEVQGPDPGVGLIGSRRVRPISAMVEAGRAW
jgi:hypothetical protein